MWLWLYCQGIGAACPLHLDAANNDLTGRRIVSNQIKELIVQLHNEVSLKECGDLKPCLVSASHHQHYLCKIKQQTPDSHISHLASVPPSLILSLLMSEPSENTPASAWLIDLHLRHELIPGLVSSSSLWATTRVGLICQQPELFVFW